MKYKILGQPGEDTCMIVSEDEKTILVHNGNPIITDYYSCQEILNSLTPLH